jgi:hypothetical protein
MIGGHFSEEGVIPNPPRFCAGYEGFLEPIILLPGDSSLRLKSGSAQNDIPDAYSLIY